MSVGEIMPVRIFIIVFMKNRPKLRPKINFDGLGEWALSDARDMGAKIYGCFLE